MQLKEMQQILMQASGTVCSAEEALKQLRASVAKASESLNNGNIPQAQLFLEHGFTNLMMTFHYLDIDPERVVQREKERQKKGNSQYSSEERVIMVFSDHAELRVSGELRGTIPLYNREDYDELREIANIFQCRLEHADHVQLNLFSLLNKSLSVYGL